MNSSKALVLIGTIFSAVSPLAAQTLFTPAGTLGASSTANVGIGTSSPVSLLHITAAADTSAVLWTEILQNSANANVVGYGVGLRLQNSSAAGSGNESNKWAGIAAVAGSTYSNRTDLAFFTNNFDSASNTTSAPIERVRITASTGNVGIGNSVPDAPLSFANSTGEKIHLYVSGGSQYGVGVYSNELRFFAGAGGSGNTTFGIQSGTGAFTERVRITGTGNVGIGTTSPDARLAVNGTVHAKEVIVDTSSSAWSDYVFAPDYRLAPLSEVEHHIKNEGHLPGIPSAAEVAERGVNMGEMQAKLLAKIEELTLHQIEQEKAVRVLQAENSELKRRLDAAGITR